MIFGGLDKLVNREPWRGLCCQMMQDMEQCPLELPSRSEVIVAKAALIQFSD